LPPIGGGSASYIGLYSGAGRSVIKHTTKIIDGSAVPDQNHGDHLIEENRLNISNDMEGSPPVREGSSSVTRLEFYRVRLSHLQARPQWYVCRPAQIIRCEDDYAALIEARKYVDGRAIEIWL